MKYRIITAAILAAFMAATAFGGSDKKPEPGKEAFLPVIKEYNRILIQAYKQGDPGLMNGVTSPEDIAAIKKLMQGLQEHNVRMIAALKSLKIKEMKLSGDMAAVSTREKWDYTYNDIKTGAMKDKKTSMVYNMVYILLKKGDTWAVRRALYDSEYVKLQETAEGQVYGEEKDAGKTRK